VNNPEGPRSISGVKTNSQKTVKAYNDWVQLVLTLRSLYSGHITHSTLSNWPSFGHLCTGSTVRQTNYTACLPH
jgi:hypothetical protein